jgi:hypothetical protein
MNKGDAILWRPSNDPLTKPMPAEIVSETENGYQIRYRQGDHWSYVWAAKDRVIEAPAGESQ